MTRRVSVFAVACAALFIQSAFPVTYTFTPLTPGAVNEFSGAGINNNGVVVGLTNGTIFRYNIGTNTYTFDNIVPVQMGSIDDSGEVYYTSSGNNADHGAIFNPSTNSITTFDEPNAPQYTFANGVSGNGIVAG